MSQEISPLPTPVPPPPKSAFVRGFNIVVAMVVSFAMVYMFYTEFIADDLLLKRDTEVETFINCLYLSVFITAGSSVAKFEGKSILSRAVTTLHCFVSLIVRIFIITLPLPIGE
jgi:hypothetical protein